MNNQISAQDLLKMLNMYKQELAEVNENKMLFKALYEKQVEINKQLLIRLEELQKPIDPEKDDE
jgi:hypothetical protein